MPNIGLSGVLSVARSAARDQRKPLYVRRVRGHWVVSAQWPERGQTYYHVYPGGRIVLRGVLKDGIHEQA